MRIIRLLMAAMVGAVMSIAISPPAHADTRTCVGAATISDPTNLMTRSAGGVTVETWEFTGTHDLCLADGTVVVATLTGQVTQIRRDDGTALLVVRETLSIPAGTLDAHILARTTPTSFEANVRLFGGTGELAGVTGQGTTIPTGPGSFRSEIVYRYP